MKVHISCIASEEQCGALYSHAVSQPECSETSYQEQKFSLPVFFIQPTSYHWSPLIQEDFCIVFTSKHAVNFFCHSLILKYPDSSMWQKLDQIAAVGRQTAEVCEQILPRFLLKKPIIYPEQKNGLSEILKSKQLSNKEIFVFTNLLGKSFETVSKTENKKISVIPVYTLIPKNELQDLKKLFSMSVGENRELKRYIFHCKSGMILNQTVFLLTKYFKVDKPIDLPENILFSVWEKSAEEGLSALQLSSRNIPWSVKC